MTTRFLHACRLNMTLEALEDITSNVQAHQAMAAALSPYIVLRAEIDYSTNMLTQVLWDPSGIRLPRANEGDVLEQYTLIINKTIQSSIHDNPYKAHLAKRITA